MNVPPEPYCKCIYRRIFGFEEGVLSEEASSVEFLVLRAPYVDERKVDPVSSTVPRTWRSQQLFIRQGSGEACRSTYCGRSMGNREHRYAAVNVGAGRRVGGLADKLAATIEEQEKGKYFHEKNKMIAKSPAMTGNECGWLINHPAIHFIALTWC